MQSARWVLLSMLATLGCGARTGLRVDRGVAPVDAGAPEDVPPLVPTCRPTRVRTRVGADVALRAVVDQVSQPMPSGYTWAFRTQPRFSQATLASTGADWANFVADREGTYEVSVSTPYRLDERQNLRCDITVVADPADPLCPSYSLEEPIVVTLPQGALQFAFEPGWSTPRINAGAGSGGIVVSDAPGDDVAALVGDFAPRTGVDLDTLAGEYETRVSASVGAVPVLVGRRGRTADGITVRRSSFRLSARATTATVLRDRLAHDVFGLNPGPAREGFSAATSFVIEVTTALDPSSGQGAVLIAAAPEARFDDVQRATAVRLQDVSNGTGLVRAGAALDVTCRRIMATRNVTADFLWLVDTSRSMEDDQERLGNTAERFFREMNTAGIDFRVGVVQAGSAAMGPDLDDPGFAFISGRDPNGARRLAYEVTYQRFRSETADDRQPYPLEGGEEEPLAAGVVTAQALNRRASDPADARRWRPGATRVMFFVTDEAGTNDDVRYFALDRARWGALREDRVRGVTRWFADEGYLTFAMANVFVRQPCPSLENFVTCVSLGNGGAYIPLSSATDAEVASGLGRIVDAVAGAASEFALDQMPVSSTLRVRVDDTLVPRSRADGFDYDDAARSLVFRGASYRPRTGQAVRAAYFFWRQRDR